MAISDRIGTGKTIPEEERQSRLDALFAKRDAAIAAGMETWSIDQINEYVRRQRARADSED